jgi:Na+-translocating ferredoxin:NAD+ oxidoreductase RnfG subunit
MLFLTGCNTVILKSDPQVLTILKNIFPEVSYYTYNEETEIYIVYDSHRLIFGYAFYAEGMGARVPLTEGGEKIPGPIIILVGLENKETIRGINVISHSETSWYWDALVQSNYFDQFDGLKIKDAYFIREGGNIDCVTGATLSSKLVLSTVREAVLRKVEELD